MSPLRSMLLVILCAAVSAVSPVTADDVVPPPDGEPLAYRILAAYRYGGLEHPVAIGHDDESGAPPVYNLHDGQVIASAREYKSIFKESAEGVDWETWTARTGSQVSALPVPQLSLRPSIPITAPVRASPRTPPGSHMKTSTC